MADAPTLTYPQQLGTVLPASIEFNIFERLSPKSSSPKQVINLYMPEEMVIPSTVAWGKSSLGAIGAGIAGYQQSDSIAGGIFNALKAGTVSAAVGKGHELIEKYARKSGMSYDANQANAAASAIAGKTLNPYMTAIFDGVDFRTFQFVFRFSPHSEDDCKRIDDIIKAFRGAALPNNQATDAIWDYPDEFQITYKFNGTGNQGEHNHPWLKKFKRAVINDIDVRYGSGDQWSQHRNGFPTMITMSLTFKEIEIVLRKDVVDGF